MKTVILPCENKDDADELSEDIKKNLKFHFVTKVEEVLNLALEKTIDTEFLEINNKPIFKAKL